MFHFRKGAAITIAALCMLSPLAAGCNNDSSSNALPETTEYVVPVPEDRISESVKGEVVDAQVGKPAEYNNTEKQEKLQVEVEAVKALDKFTNKDEKKTEILFVEMNLTNNSGKVLDLSYLTHFSTDVDGEITDVGHSALANSQATKYYANTGRKLVHQQVAAGEKVSFVVALEVPSERKELKLIYMPYKYYSNDTIDFLIKPEDIQHIAG
ncbi:DUF4352 domain-containing protein [Ruminococcus sp.]|uniref:DUF4352 domain-containing protein n=1 Tax=Ruminococcus sp. TaxID=41978 RepID=UPI0025DD319E|nr:DUF4352 domain-containing protein [Ruminococcus sp.]MCI5816392.1 DUF4352 domain-containing protein [Ruminococcus sp.]MDD7555181.1 DUF4352 domain-containing protein [Ruminococcus sp.]MDY4962924.1 DUF4352 domain-containing protein [Ruminococcus callidus]